MGNSHPLQKLANELADLAVLRQTEWARRVATLLMAIVRELGDVNARLGKLERSMPKK